MGEIGSGQHFSSQDSIFDLRTVYPNIWERDDNTISSIMQINSRKSIRKYLTLFGKYLASIGKYLSQFGKYLCHIGKYRQILDFQFYYGR
ncbi:hypothetical protein [Planococcus halotolerans]|uniref:hypothetical protein n=1 Tax=Planococcus halotolerans TaxID=2233542 RepID=UPI001401C376|nr:hypothetical protein [Planococcus halotolerans]